MKTSHFLPGALLLSAMLCAPIPAGAAVPLGGLTVAVSPAGDKLVAGGDTRTLLVLDPQSLAVKQRVWVETTITGLAFSKAGTMLAVLDTSGTVALYSTADWTLKATLPKRDRMSTAPAADIFAGLEGGQKPAIVIHALSDGRELRRVALANDRIAAFGLSADGSKLAVLYAPVDSTSEPKVAANAIPKDLRDAARDEFVQKNDGRDSRFVVIDLGTGNPLIEKTLYFSTTDAQAQLFFQGNDVILANYVNVGARIKPDGEVQIFKTANGFNYGMGLSADHGLLISGGLRTFAITATDSLVGVKGEVPRLPGWPEYFKGFDATANGGAIYGATTGYRIVRIGRDGKVLAVEPVR